MAISYLLSLVFVGGLLLVAGLLLLSAWRTRNPRSAPPEDLPVDAAQYGPHQTNNWLKLLRAGYVGACLVVLGFHGYWGFGVDADEGYSAASARDLRNRRIAEAGLKGWVFDRTGSHDKALIRYALNGRNIERTYPLGEAAVHVTGYTDFIYGSGGIERAYQDHLTTPTSITNTLASTVPVGKDLQTTIDFELQRTAYELLKKTGKRSAVVVLGLPNNEVMAIASYPSFDPLVIGNEEEWKALNAGHEQSPDVSPLTDRALKTYYLPGSTFKVLVAVAALEHGLGNAVFPCRAEGFTPQGHTKAVVDDNGGGGHGNPNLAQALQFSCNQYFAQLALELGPERLSATAARFGIAKDFEGKARDTNMFRFGAADPRDFERALAPPQSRVIVPKRISKGFERYELAIEGFGQGPDQMTIMQLALIAAGVASPDGKLIKPTFELNLEPVELGQVATPENARIVREMMKLVVDQGTATRAFAPLLGRVSAAGKTGTAQREVIVRDPKTLKPVMIRNRRGKQVPKRDLSIDALFIGFAPFESPKIAFAVIVEGGGHGGEAAAPIAVALIEKARALGYVPLSPSTQKPPVGPRRPAAGTPRGTGAR